MKNTIALAFGLLCAAAQAQTMKYKVEVSYPESGARTWEMATMVGTKSTIQNLSTQTVVGEINSNFGEVTQVPAERMSGITASLTPQEISKDGKVLTSLTYTIWNKGQQASKGTHVVQLKPGEKASLPAFDGQTLAITLLN
jgi:hypothetical protein